MPLTYKPLTARAAAVLPASGAYDSSPTSIDLQSFDSFSFLFSYTRGAASGSTAYKIEISMDNSTWYQLGYVEAQAVTTGADVQQKEQRAEILYGSTGASAERTVTPTLIVISRYARISFKEVGVVGTPGTVDCTFVGVTSY